MYDLEENKGIGLPLCSFVDNESKTYRDILLGLLYSNDDYKLLNIKVDGWDAFLVAIYDPSKVKVISKEVLATGGPGERTIFMCERTNSRVCINAGGFKPNAQDMATDVPVGYIIQDGEIIWASNANAKGNLIGFTNDNKLVLTKATGAEALEMGIRDAVEFGPFLIINGKAMQSMGDGGFGSAPRTAIAQRKDGVVLFLVTNPKFYDGPTLDSVIKTLQKYGAYNAANLDGGSSSTLVINNKIINTPRNSYGVHQTLGRSVVSAFALTK